MTKVIKFISLGVILTLPLATNAASIIGQSVTMNYSAGSWPANSITDTQTSVAGAGVEFTTRSPVAPNQDLFDVDFADGSLTITALQAFTNTTSVNFNWDFLINPLSDLVFTEATLVSNTLFSISPFTFSVNPTLTVNDQLLNVNRFMACGSGTCTIADGGALNIAFSVTPVPAPAAVWLFASTLIGLIGMRKKLTK